MALINCPECGTEVSDRAATCVKCGCPIGKPADIPVFSPPVIDDIELDEIDQVQPFWKKHKVALIVVAIFLLIAAIANPDEQAHQRAVGTFLRNEIQKSGVDPLDGNAIVLLSAAMAVGRQNLVFFSLTRYAGETIGIGAFGFVWTFIDVPTGSTQAGQGAASAQQGGANTFTDSRDGQRYKMVKIGGRTWMAQNLNYQTGNSWCYDNNSYNCDNYGRLYDWNTAVNACPSGWVLPSTMEWDNLLKTVGGKRTSFSGEGDDIVEWVGAGNRLKTKTGWNKYEYNNTNSNGTDDYGFSALPGGGPCVGFGSLGDFGHWWTATGNGKNIAFGRGMGNFTEGVLESEWDKNCGFSVRCVRND